MKNILIHGSMPALDWLFKTYSREQIIEIVRNPRPGEWNKKSLNFWSLVFNVTPKLTKRF